MTYDDLKLRWLRVTGPRFTTRTFNILKKQYVGYCICYIGHKLNVDLRFVNKLVNFH